MDLHRFLAQIYFHFKINIYEGICKSKIRLTKFIPVSELLFLAINTFQQLNFLSPHSLLQFLNFDPFFQLLISPIAFERFPQL